MFKEVRVGLPASGGTVSNTVRSKNVVLSVQIPTLPETGQLVAGGIAEQTRQVFRNLGRYMEAAGGSLADVMLVQVYIVDSADWAAMHKVWGETFKLPFPARATVVVKELMLEGMQIEIVAHAQLR